MEYDVEIITTVSHRVTVHANSPDEAEQIALSMEEEAANCHVETEAYAVPVEK
jgi:hypothetical protein